MIDLPGISVDHDEHYKYTKDYIDNYAKAFVFLKTKSHVSFDSSDEKEFYNSILKANPSVFDRSFMIINMWDDVSKQDQADALDKLRKSLNKYGYNISDKRIYTVSAKNYLQLKQIESEESGNYGDIDNLLRYGDVATILGEPSSVINNNIELSDFIRFKIDLVNYINLSAIEELFKSAQVGFIKAIDVLSTNLSINIGDSDIETESFEIKEKFISSSLSKIKKGISEVLDGFEDEIKFSKKPIWSVKTKDRLVSDIHKVIHNNREIDNIIGNLKRGGPNTPEKSDFISDLFEIIKLDIRVVKLLRESTEIDDIVERMKFELQKKLVDLINPLPSQVTDILNPTYIEMRINGIYENLRSWEKWQKDHIEPNIQSIDANSANIVINAIDELFTADGAKLDSKVKSTISYHFQRYVMPKLKEIFGITTAFESGEFSDKLRLMLRQATDTEHTDYYRQYQDVLKSSMSIMTAHKDLVFLKNSVLSL